MKRWDAPSKRRDEGLGAGSEDRPGRAAIVVGRHEGTVVVTVHGVLDLVKAGQLGIILVDLNHATAGDADSLLVFTDAAERAQRRGGTVRLDGPPPVVQNTLELRGLDAFLSVAPPAGPSLEQRGHEPITEAV
jgi:anti-anti-sigma regulatory factor